MFFLPSLFSIPRFTISILMSVLMLAALAYVGFVITITQSKPQMPDTVTDAVVVLTGGPGRVEAGFQIVADNKARAMLITGVHNGVKLSDLLNVGLNKEAIRNAVLAHCCITLGYVAESTLDNAAETSDWMKEQKLAPDASIRIVTSDYHMPRALLQFKRALPEARLYPWPVKSDREADVFWRNVTSEFGKYVLSWLSDKAEQS